MCRFHSRLSFSTLLRLVLANFLYHFRYRATRACVLSGLWTQFPLSERLCMSVCRIFCCCGFCVCWFWGGRCIKCLFLHVNCECHHEIIIVFHCKYLRADKNKRKLFVMVNVLAWINIFGGKCMSAIYGAIVCYLRDYLFASHCHNDCAYKRAA